MSKYNMMATRQDWDNLYAKCDELGFDVKPFKKSQNYDGAVYAFYVMAKNKLGKTLSDVQELYPMYVYGKTLKAVTNN